VRSAFNRRPRRAFILVFAALAAFCFVAAGRDGFERQIIAPWGSGPDFIGRGPPAPPR
jgi:hypothetical protein